MIAPADNEGTETINWTRPMLKRFHAAYCKAYSQNQDQQSVFEFDGHQFVLGYAAYLIEFLRSQFGLDKKKH